MVERRFERLSLLYHNGKSTSRYICKYPQHIKQILGISYDQFVLLVKQA
jgi:hypothetical protein